MKEYTIKIKPFEILSILNFKSVQQMNEHGYVQLSARIRSDRKEEYIQKAAKETWVEIFGYDESGNEKAIFCGILSEFSVSGELDGCVMDLLIYTGSKLMDVQKHQRSFQDSGYTYRQIADCCNEAYPKAGMIMTAGKNASVSGFLMQYQETDWAFLKRLASSLHTMLVPSCAVIGEKYFFGIPEKRAEGNLDTEDYTVIQENTGNQNRANKSISICYRVSSRECYSLGDYMIFHGEKCYIWKMETIWKGNELWHTYDLKKKEDLWVPQIYQNELIGLSLMGRVNAIEKEQVQICLEDDENHQSGNCWFAFSTVYSSPDGTGWYCMPEKGDAVRLYFPTEKEENAFVSSAFHENTGAGLRTKPEIKRWRNKEGKEICLTPEKILITNNCGMSVELSEQRGIKVKSNASVNIEASENIYISSSGASLEFAAANKIVFQQGNSTMELSDGIKLAGSTVKIQ